jgi:iron complex outermembrane receptor protein
MPGFGILPGTFPSSSRCVVALCRGNTLRLSSLTFVAAIALAPCAASAVETVVVTAPLPGAPVDADKLPGTIETLSMDDLRRDRETDVLPNLAADELSDVRINDEQGSPLQPDFVFHGFKASPIAGTAEGIAVYQDGVRLNE